MTDIPPSDPRSPQRRNFDYDELIGILVAFATIGGILFWVLWRQLPNWDWTRLPSLMANQTATAPERDDTQTNNLIPAPMESLPATEIKPNPILPLPAPPSATKEQTNEESPSSLEERDSSAIAPEQPQIPTVPPIVPIPSTDTEGEFRVTTPVQKSPAIPEARKFTDVPDNFWASKFIDALSSRNVIKGLEDNSFRPNQPVTRAEFASILQQAFDKPGSSKALKFNDLENNFWAIPAINESVTMDFLSGYPDPSNPGQRVFRAGKRIPKEEVIVALVSGLGLKPPANPQQIVSIYPDANNISPWAVEKIAIATANGLIVNHPDPQQLAPKREATRAEVAVMIHQALVRMGRLNPIESENIVKPQN